MDNISLQRIDESNFLEAFRLKVGQEQEKFVSSPIRSLAQAYVYYNQCTPFGIYLNDNEMVGYVMVIYDYDLDEYDIWHLMIDQKYQHRGYGAKAMEKCLDYIKTKPFGTSDKVALTCNRDNITAMHLYQELGFEETGNVDEDEVELALVMN